MKHIGLNDDEVIKSRQEHGSNSISEVKKESFWDKLKSNFGDPMIKILCVALAINVIFAITGQSEWYETFGIALAVILATLVSTYSEYNNENAFQKLQDEASKIQCKVYRNGSITEVFIDDIVVGDCILLQSGDKIPADGILIDGNIRVDQSVLNGESEEAKKFPPEDGYCDWCEAMDLLNNHKVYRGTIVCNGNGVMRVAVVGDESVYGKIASELQTEEERDSPLKVKLSNLAHGISKFGYAGGIAIAVALLFQRIVVHNGFDMATIIAYCSDWMVVLNDIVQAVMLAVIIIVMAVPEGLPLMIAIVSAQNMGKMLKDNVLVRKINGIETAGSLNILFSDKTGTITKGQLEVVTFIDGDLNKFRTADEVNAPLKKLISLTIGENSTALINYENGHKTIIGGNATERAVLGFMPESNENINVTKVASIPFNSDNKYSATEVKGDYNYTLLKGAPEKIVSKCKYYFDANGEKKPFKNLEMLDKEMDRLAARAIRVLALAVSENSIEDDMLPDDGYILVGILGIRDEVRPESITAIKEVHDAGVQVVMITGDRKETAVAIAAEAGLLQSDDDVVLTSDQLNSMTDDELKAIIKNIKVVARALPSDKSRLVRLAQELNLVAGMTGDGVNDSPALKKADVGFAMGGGTEVAKEAGDIVILDDNFNSIDKAILYGRTIFNSIRKFIIFQLTINVAAVLVSFASPLLGMESPLSITQILWINLVMDTLAALAFGGEPPLKRYMNEKPKSRNEQIVSSYMWSQIILGSVWIFMLSMLMLITHSVDGFFRVAPDQRYLMTGYFVFFIFAAVFNAFNARTEKINLLDNLNGNKGFLKIIAIIVVVQVIMTYFGGEIFRCYGLLANEWIFVLCMAITIIPVDLARKALFFRHK